MKIKTENILQIYKNDMTMYRNKCITEGSYSSRYIHWKKLHKHDNIAPKCREAQSKLNINKRKATIKIKADVHEIKPKEKIKEIKLVSL